MKQLSIILLIVLGGILCCGTIVQARWYKGITHIHSTFSDGDRTPGMLKQAVAANHFDFLIVTDHFEQINREKKLTSAVTADFGFNKYLKDYEVTSPLLCLAGAEITLGHCHTLVLANLPSVSKMAVPGNISGLISDLNSKDALPVAAHPNWSSYIYDTSQAEDIAGIEFFNENAASYKKTLAWYLSIIAKGKRPFVTAGCDSHSSLEPSDLIRWQRCTYVWSNESLSREAIINGLKAGVTYASNHGAYLAGMPMLPQREHQKYQDVQFNYKIGFLKHPSTKKIVRFYRDGQLVDEKTLTFPNNANEESCNLRDEAVQNGRHAYVLEVEGYLVTSPMCLDIQREKRSQSTVSLESSTGDAIKEIFSSVQDFEMTFEVNVQRREGSVYFRTSGGGMVKYVPDGHGKHCKLYTYYQYGYRLVFIPYPNQGGVPAISFVKVIDYREGAIAATNFGCPSSSGIAIFTLRVEGNNMRVYEGGQLILKVRDYSYRSGKIAWRVYGDQNNPAKADFKLIEFKEL